MQSQMCSPHLCASAFNYVIQEPKANKNVNYFDKLVGIFEKMPNKIAASKKLSQSYCLPIARNHLHNYLIIKQLFFSLTALVTNFNHRSRGFPSIKYHLLSSVTKIIIQFLIAKTRPTAVRRAGCHDCLIVNVTLTILTI